MPTKIERLNSKISLLLCEKAYELDQRELTIEYKEHVHQVRTRINTAKHNYFKEKIKQLGYEYKHPKKISTSE